MPSLDLAPIWPVQAKLTINQLGDQYEQEADRIAEQVMATPAHAGISGASARIQRFVGKESGQMDKTPASVDRVLASPGRPLDPELQEDMGQRFGRDFSQVRVHSGEAAEQSAREVKANAYTVGHDIVFGAGRFVPGTHEGRRLIAHELTHVVQQRFAPTSLANGLSVGGPADSFEAEAAQAECSVISPQSVPLPGNHATGLSQAHPATHLATRPIIQRQRRADLPEPSLQMHLPSDSIEIGANENVSTTNPNLIKLASAFKTLFAANPKAHIVMSGYLDTAGYVSNSAQVNESRRIMTRMTAILDLLETLGVPRSALTIQPPSEFSSTMGGKVIAELFNEPKSLAPLLAENQVTSLASPASSTPSVAANPEPEGPGLDFAKFTTIEINNPKFSLEIKIPKSIGIKFKAFEAKLSIPKGGSLALRPVRGIPGLKIGLSGEITKLADLIESPTPTSPEPIGSIKPKPVRFSLSIGIDGKYYSVDSTTSADLSERAINTGISLTLLGSNVKHQVPASVINDLNVAGEQLRKVVNKLMGTPDQPAATMTDELQASPSPATPSPELTSDLSDLADAIGKIIEGMDKIDKSKGEGARSTLTVGLTATIPYGQAGEGTLNNQSNPVSAGINIGGTF